MSTVLTQENKGIVTVRLNRPEVRNAFHPTMIAELTKTFKQLRKNKDCCAVILCGEGPSFCAGADLEWMKSMAKYTRAQNKKDAEALFDMFSEIESFPGVVIGQLHGHVMGGALGLAAVCDLVVAEATTQFCFSEVKLGLSPAVISAFVKNKVSLAEMNRWFLTAEVFSSTQAQKMGLVHEVASETAVVAQTQKWVDALRANAPQAVRETKQLLKSVSVENRKLQLKKMTTTLIAQLRVSAEGQEGLKSFLEKRKPQWLNKRGSM